ncbi:MAG: hypothetical protein HQK50_11085, partial [Oligoflexia bacterium]|nr:hypothetical protein [Oligoflexia bacterium]
LVAQASGAAIITAGEEGAKSDAAVSGEGSEETGAAQTAAVRAINLGGVRGKISVSQQGEILVNGNALGELSLVEFSDIHALKKEGDSLFINSDEKDIFKSEVKSQIHQGFVEGSNVDAILEMSNLIKANRQFESMQRALKTYDNIANRGVNDIAKF